MLVSVTQGAKELGVSVEHIRRQIRAGRWPYYKLGPKATRIDPDEIRELGRSRPPIAGDGRQTSGE
jgi:excisionase family DNA binding protein